MKKAQKEIDSVLGQGEPTYELIKKLQWVANLDYLSISSYYNNLSVEKRIMKNQFEAWNSMLDDQSF